MCWSPPLRSSSTCPGASSLPGIAAEARKPFGGSRPTSRTLGLADRVSLLGAVGPEELTSLYAGADLFVLASRFEGYGMAYTEAIAHGVPVVGTTAGAIAETVPGDAGVLLPPDDVGMLAAALRRLMESPEQRERLAAGARAARFPTWSEQAARIARVLDALA